MLTQTSSETGHLLSLADRRPNSIEINFNLGPKSSTSYYDSLPSIYSKSYDFNMVIKDKAYFKRFLYISLTILVLILALLLLAHFLLRKHNHHHPSDNLRFAVNHALTFFDAQKSGHYPNNSPVKFRGDSGLKDGDSSNSEADLVGGFYDSGNNIKFTFTTAYTVTILSWSVVEYGPKYEDINELDHVRDIIKWGTEYLLKAFVPPTETNPDQAVLYSQVGSGRNDTKVANDYNCWQRPEDIKYERPVSKCGTRASDLAGEIVAALSAASIVFKDNISYSQELSSVAEKLFELALINEDPTNQETYTNDPECGGEATRFYNSSGYKDEMIWAGTWLFFATGNTSYLSFATENDRFESALSDEEHFEKGVFYWNNKLTATTVLLTRVLYFHDLGYPYESTLGVSFNITNTLMCSYLSRQHFKRTPGGLILLRPDEGAPLQYAATASFLSKLYSDYLNLLQISGGPCTDTPYSVEMLRNFSMSQVNYILGDNPMKISYVVGYGAKYPTHVHHRGTSIPWDGKEYLCEDGDKWLNSKEPNPNLLLGAMVSGPDKLDNFVDERAQPLFTEPTIASNAGLVAALIASLHSNFRTNLGIDKVGIFYKHHLT